MLKHVVFDHVTTANCRGITLNSSKYPLHYAPSMLKTQIKVQVKLIIDMLTCVAAAIE